MMKDAQLVYTAKKTFGIVQQSVSQKLYKDSNGKWFILSQTAENPDGVIVPMAHEKASQWALVAGMSAYEVVQHFNVK